MKVIDTSVVTTSRQYPGLANVGGQSIGNGGAPSKFQGLDFLQQANMDNANALASAMASDLTKATILSGCVITNVYSGLGLTDTTSITEGWVYYVIPSTGQGEIFYVPAQTVSHLTGTPVNASWVANPTDISPNPLTTLSDGTTTSIHNQRTVQISSSFTASAGNLPDIVNWITSKVVQNTTAITTLNTEVATLNTEISNGTVTAITYQNGYSHLDYTSTNASTYRLDGRGNVYLSAYFTSPGSISSKIIATLPSGCFPLNPRNFFLWEQTSGTVCVITIDTSGHISAQTLAGGNVPTSDTFSFEAIYNVMDASV